MPDPLALTITDGTSRVVIADTTGLPIYAPLTEISPALALIQSDAEFEPNAYLDLTLELKGQPARKFFAHVMSTDEKGVRIRWMHLDPGEEQKLKGLLVAYARTSASTGGPGHGTRRIIRPKSETFTPFRGPTEVEMPAPPPAKEAAAAKEATKEPAKEKESEHRTRRVIKPGARAEAPAEVADEHEPTAAAPGEESKGHPVVLAPTDKFEKMRHIEDAERPAPRAPSEAQPTPAASGAPAAELPPDPLADLPEAQSSSSSGRTAVIGKDGRMDVGAAIRQKAKTVKASDLAARHDKVRVLNMGTIKSLIQEAVEEAASHLTRALGEAERKRLLEEAEEGFKERLKAFEVDKKSAEEKARLLQNELNAATELLDQERKRSIAADQFTVSEAGLAEIDVRMAKIIERAVQRGEAGPELELKLREMIAHILDTEREKMREKELSAHNDKIALLEKKVARLAFSLDSTEKERDEARLIAEEMEKNGISIADVKNKFRIGLSGDDPNRERKLALMKELVEQNRELRIKLGLKLIDPAVAAKEAAEEAKQKREEAEKARALALEDRAEARADAAAEKAKLAAPAAPAAPAAAGTGSRAPAAEAAADAGPSEPVIDPDDQPWEPPKPGAGPKSDADERGVKVLRDYKKFEPPPLVPAVSVADGIIPVQINPDDQPWEPPPSRR